MHSLLLRFWRSLVHCFGFALMELLCCPEAVVALEWGQLEDLGVQLVVAHLLLVEEGHFPLVVGDLGRLRWQPCSAI